MRVNRQSKMFCLIDSLSTFRTVNVSKVLK